MYAWFKKKEKKIKKIPVWNVGKVTAKFYLNYKHETLPEPITLIEKTYLGWVSDPQDLTWGYVKIMSSGKAKSYVDDIFEKGCITRDRIVIPAREILHVEICKQEAYYVDKDDNDVEFNEAIHEVK